MKFEQSSAISKGLGNALEIISEVGSLPLIRGTWYYVDPKSGSNTADGRTIATTVKDLRSAYGLCTTSAGDGICILSRPSGTVADTTTYLGGSLLWTKHGITVVGVCSEQGYNARARVSSIDRAYAATTQFSWTTTTITDTRSGFLTNGFEVGDAILCTAAAGTAITVVNKITAVTASTITLASAVTANATPGVAVLSTHCVPLMNVSGKGNSFYNLSFIQAGSVADDVGGVLVSGDNNYFRNCHLNGGAHATQAAVAGCYDLTLDASDCRFDLCVFGSHTIARAGTNAHIVLGVSTDVLGSSTFEDCTVVSNSTTATHCAIFVTDVATLGAWIIFNRCTFTNWYAGALTALTQMVHGTTTPTNRGILLNLCSMVGWAIFAHADNDAVFTNLPASANHGGRAVVTNT